MDVLPFHLETPQHVPVASISATRRVQPEAQACRMAVTVVVEALAPLDGNYDLFVETCLPSGVVFTGFDQTGDRIMQINAPGTYSILISNPILDQLRMRVETDAVTPANAGITVTWHADRQMTLVP